MDFSTEISQSTQFLVQEIRKMFDVAKARLDWRFARLLQPQAEEVDEPCRGAVSPPPPLPVVGEPYRVVASPPPHPSVVYEPYRDEAMAGADARAHYGGHLPCERGGLAAAWQPARSLAFAAGDARLAVAPRRDTRAMATMATKSVGDLTEADLKGKHITDDILPTTEYDIATVLVDYTTTSNSPTKCSTMVLNRGDCYVSYPASSLKTGRKKGGSIVEAVQHWRGIVSYHFSYPVKVRDVRLLRFYSPSPDQTLVRPIGQARRGSCSGTDQAGEGQVPRDHGGSRGDAEAGRPGGAVAPQHRRMLAKRITLKHVETSNAADQKVAEDQTGAKTEVVVSDVAVQKKNVEDKKDGMIKATSLPTTALEAEGQFGADAELEDRECILNDISVVEPEEFASSVIDALLGFSGMGAHCVCYLLKVYAPATKLSDGNGCTQSQKLRSYRGNVPGLRPIPWPSFILLSRENKLTKSSVMVTAGAIQAFVNLVLTPCDAGDSVVMFAPNYFNAYMSFQMTGVTDILVGGCDSRTLHPDADWLEKVLKDNEPIPKLVTVVNPGNPSGAFISRPMFERISDLCKNAGAWLVVVNTYEYFMYGGRAGK